MALFRDLHSKAETDREAPAVQAHEHALAAEEAERRGDWSTAKKEHNKACEKFQAATEFVEDQSTLESLQLLSDFHKSQAKKKFEAEEEPSEAGDKSVSSNNVKADQQPSSAKYSKESEGRRGPGSPAVAALSDESATRTDIVASNLAKQKEEDEAKKVADDPAMRIQNAADEIDELWRQLLSLGIRRDSAGEKGLLSSSRHLSSALGESFFIVGAKQRAMQQGQHGSVLYSSSKMTPLQMLQMSRNYQKERPDKIDSSFGRPPLSISRRASGTADGSKRQDELSADQGLTKIRTNYYSTGVDGASGKQQSQQSRAGAENNAGDDGDTAALGSPLGLESEGTFSLSGSSSYYSGGSQLQSLELDAKRLRYLHEESQSEILYLHRTIRKLNAENAALIKDCENKERLVEENKYLRRSMAQFQEQYEKRFLALKRALEEWKRQQSSQNGRARASSGVERRGGDTQDTQRLQEVKELEDRIRQLRISLRSEMEANRQKELQIQKYQSWYRKLEAGARAKQKSRAASAASAASASLGYSGAAEERASPPKIPPQLPLPPPSVAGGSLFGSRNGEGTAAIPGSASLGLSYKDGRQTYYDRARDGPPPSSRTSPGAVSTGTTPPPTLTGQRLSHGSYRTNASSSASASASSSSSSSSSMSARVAGVMIAAQTPQQLRSGEGGSVRGQQEKDPAHAQGIANQYNDRVHDI